MAEMTRTINMELTFVCKDVDPDEILDVLDNEETRKNAAAAFKTCLGADDVVVTSCKTFIRD